MEPTLEAVVFEITDALGQREFDRALERLSVMLKLRAEPSPCSARSAAICVGSTPRASCRRPGRPRRTLPRSAASRPFAANKCFAQARRLSDRFCAQAVLLCCEADRQMKTSYDDPARILELLILQLAEEARHD